MFGRLAILIVILNPLVASGQQRLDDHGFPLPEGAVARLGDLRFAQPGRILSMALSPDAKVIATAGENVSFFDVDTGRVLRIIPATFAAHKLAFSQDGALLAASGQGMFSIWHTATGKVQWQDRGKRDKGQSYVTALRFLANDRIFAMARTDSMSRDSPNWPGALVQLWSVEKGTLLREWEVDESKKKLLQGLQGSQTFSAVTLTPSGNQMAWLACAETQGQSAGCAFLFDTLTGRLLREVRNLPTPAQEVAFLDEAQHLLVMSGNGDHTIIDLSDRQAHVSFAYRTKHFDIGRPFMASSNFFVNEFGLARDGKSFFVQDEAGLIRRLLENAKPIQQWPDRCEGLAFFPGSKKAVLARGNRLIMCDANLAPLCQQMGHLEAPNIFFQMAGELVSSTWAGLSRDRGRVIAWDVHGRKIRENIRRAEPPSIGRTPCSFDANYRLLAHHDDGIVIHDLVANRRISRLEGVQTEDTQEIWNVRHALSADGKRALVASHQGGAAIVRWFDTASGRKLGQYRISPRNRISARLPVGWFSTEGALFGYVTRDGQLTLVDCGNGERKLTVGLPNRILEKGVVDENDFATWEYRSAAFDRFLIAQRDDDSTNHQFIVMDRETGERLRRFSLNSSHSLFDWQRRLSSDGRIIGAHRLWSKEVQAYETATGRLRGVLQAANVIASFDFSPDGKLLATSCDDTSILLWDLNRPLSGKPDLPLPRSNEDANKLWQMLADVDPAAMEPALWALVRAPAWSVPLLRHRLQPARGLEPAAIRSLIVQLDHANFTERMAAMTALAKLDELAIPSLYATLEKPLALEQKQRVEKLLKELDGPVKIPSCLRELRALEVLERIATDEALAIVEHLTTGHPDALVTREARLVLSRMRAASR